MDFEYVKRAETILYYTHEWDDSGRYKADYDWTFWGNFEECYDKYLIRYWKAKSEGRFESYLGYTSIPGQHLGDRNDDMDTVETVVVDELDSEAKDSSIDTIVDNQNKTNIAETFEVLTDLFVSGGMITESETELISNIDTHGELEGHETQETFYKEFSAGLKGERASDKFKEDNSWITTKDLDGNDIVLSESNNNIREDIIVEEATETDNSVGDSSEESFDGETEKDIRISESIDTFITPTITPTVQSPITTTHKTFVATDAAIQTYTQPAQQQPTQPTQQTQQKEWRPIDRQFRADNQTVGDVSITYPPNPTNATFIDTVEERKKKHYKEIHIKGLEYWPRISTKKPTDRYSLHVLNRHSYNKYRRANPVLHQYQLYQERRDSA